MAGLDWVQVDVGFPMSLPVVCAARALGMERRAFLGAMVELQIWAVQALPSGRFEPFPASAGHAPDASTDEAGWCEAVESAVRWTGAPGAFWDTLLRVGILVREDDSVRLTLCDRYVQVLDKRKKEAERKRRERAHKAGSASEGRPADTSGTSSSRKRKDKESQKKSPSSAAAGNEGGTIPGRLAPVPMPPDEDVSVDTGPVQLALPGTHLVPVTPPPTHDAAAFFETFQSERARAFRGVPREDMPSGWSEWYAQALAKVGGDESRLLEACRAYLQSDWGRSRQPVCTALAFCSPKVWVRYVPALKPEPSEESGPPSVDVSTEAGRVWRECLGGLYGQGKRYALSWLTQATPVDVEDGHLVLAVPDPYFLQWVEAHYGAVVEQRMRELGLQGVRWQLAEHEDTHRRVHDWTSRR